MREILLGNEIGGGSTQLRVREMPDGSGGTDYELIGLPNGRLHRIGHAYENTGIDTWEVPDPIVNTPFEDLDFSPPGGLDQHWVPHSPIDGNEALDLGDRSARIAGSVNGQELRFSAEDRDQFGVIYGSDHWYRSDGGWTSSGPSLIRSDAFRVLNPCNDWSINLVAQARSRFAVEVFGDTTPQPPGVGPITVGGIGIGPVTIFVLLQKVFGDWYEVDGEWTRDSAWFAGISALVPFACGGDRYIGMNLEDMVPFSEPGLLEATISYTAATRTLTWNFGKYGLPFGTPNSHGQYTDEFGFAGYCDGCEVGKVPGDFEFFSLIFSFKYTFRSLSIS